MIPAPFAYHRPRSLDETLGLLAQLGEDARVVAGGDSLIPMMKLRLAGRSIWLTCKIWSSCVGFGPSPMR